METFAAVAAVVVDTTLCCWQIEQQYIPRLIIIEAWEL